jgi:adenine-specific DNA-methyltransferase
MSSTRQLALLDVPRPMREWTPDPSGEHGEVFTRRWVVDLMLDLVGYSPDAHLATKVAVEPSCGCGAFVLPMVERLIDSCRQYGRTLADAEHAIRGFDLLEHNAEFTRKAVAAKLLESGETVEVAEFLSCKWITTGVVWLAPHHGRSADFVIGNPPYIRLEDVPNDISDAYRTECTTMRGRADIYVGFYEKGLELLRPGGKLAFICADRWMRNQYGGRLRQFISDNFAVDSIITMHDVDAFEEDVAAYPSIAILRSGSQRQARVVEANASFDRAAGEAVLQWMNGTDGTPVDAAAFEAVDLPGWFSGPGLWPSGSPHQLELIADLEQRFPALEDPRTGTRIGIGVASGCDDVYISSDSPDVESDRLLPLVMASDIRAGTIEWSGHHLVNPWKDGKLVDLGDYPRLGTFYEANGDRLRSRHVAKKQPRSWYRTIDRIDPGLLAKPKLLLPDMKAAAHPVLDPGDHYPHHNLYFVVSDAWDLEVLGGILLSDVANLFVGAYCVKMRGGTYRFQAQYLRKIRVPDPSTISEQVARNLQDAFRLRDAAKATTAAAAAYRIDASVFTGG